MGFLLALETVSIVIAGLLFTVVGLVAIDQIARGKGDE